MKIKRQKNTVRLEEVPTTTVTTKGQVTVPQPIRKKLGLNPGDTVRWVVLDNGEVKIKRVDPLEAMRQTIGIEFRKKGITRKQLETLLEETRSELFPKKIP